MIGILKFRILLLVFAIAALPNSLMAEEKGKIDGCLTSLYNYPASVEPKREARPLLSNQMKDDVTSLPKKTFGRFTREAEPQIEEISNYQN